MNSDSQKRENNLTGNSYPLWIFHPLEPLRLRWDYTVTLIMLYVLIDVPIKICFGIDTPLHSAWSLMDLAVDIFFLVDIVFNFNTGFIDNAQLITCRRKIASKYLKTWFLLDVVTSVPFDWVISLLRGVSLRRLTVLPRLLKIARIARLLKLLRLVRLYSKMSQWEDSNSHSATMMRIAKFISMVLITAHIAGCIFVGVANSYRSHDRSYENNYGYDEHSWIYRNLNTWEDPPPYQYLRALYWAFTTLTTVGYGDVTPALPYEVLFTIAVQICGTSLFGYIIGNVASLITRDDETVMRMNEKIQSVKNYMRYRNFPVDIIHKIRSHYEYSWKRSQVYKETEILEELPQALRTECALFIHKDIIQNVPFIADLGIDVVPNFVTRLKPMTAMHGDVVVQEGLYGNEMYFLAEGVLGCFLTYKRDDLKIDRVSVKKITKGEHFAEYAVMMDQAMHPVSVVAESYCDVFVLTRSDLLEFGEEFPLIYSRMITKSKARFVELFKEINKTRQQHIMRLNYLEWKRQNALLNEKEGGSDESDAEAENLPIISHPNSITTLKMRLEHRRQTVAQRQKKNEGKGLLPHRHKSVLEDYLPKGLQDFMTLPQYLLPQNNRLSTPTCGNKVTKELTPECTPESRDSTASPPRLIRNNELETKLKVKCAGVAGNVDSQNSRNPSSGSQTSTRASSSFALLARQNVRKMLSSLSSRQNSRAHSEIQRPSICVERPKLAFFILIKVMAWKNRAKLKVAMRHIDVVEQRHVEKFHLQKKANVKPKSRANSYNPGPLSSRVPESSQLELSKAIAALQSQQNETQDDLKDIQITVEGMKGQLLETNRLLAFIATEITTKLNAPQYETARVGKSPVQGNLKKQPTEVKMFGFNKKVPRSRSSTNLNEVDYARNLSDSSRRDSKELLLLEK